MQKETNYKHCNVMKGNTFNAPTQVADQIINFQDKGKNKPAATYKAEPLWRSSITMAVLSWVSLITGVLGLLPIGKLVGFIYKRSLMTVSVEEFQKWSWMLFILIFLFLSSLSLLRITRKQTRHPLFCNFAISGYGRRITLEKIHTSKCPRCGGKMKYYNKPVEYIYTRDNNGNSKKEIIKRIPVLECRRNAEHWYKVDIAEERII